MLQPVEQHSLGKKQMKTGWYFRQVNLTKTHKKTDYKGDGRVNDISSAFVEFRSLKFESMNSLSIWERYLQILSV